MAFLSQLSVFVNRIDNTKIARTNYIKTYHSKIYLTSRYRLKITSLPVSPLSPVTPLEPAFPINPGAPRAPFTPESPDIPYKKQENILKCYRCTFTIERCL